MIITNKLTKEEFIKASFLMILSRPIFKFLLAVSPLIIMLCLYIDPTIILTLIISCILFTLIIYYNSQKNFSTNKRFQEAVIYQFDNDFLKIKGDSFETNMTLSKIHKVTFTDKWIFLWQSNRLATPIYINDISSALLKDLKVILDKNSVKYNS